MLVIKALEDVELPRKTVVTSTALQATSSKRKSARVGDDDYDDDDGEYAEGDSDSKNGEGYNTRYKGVKRVKVHGERPEPQQKRRVGRPRKSVASEGGVEGEGRRKRGRPRKDRSSVVEGEQIKVSSSKGKRKSLKNRDAVMGEVIPSISKRPRGRPRKNASGVVGSAKIPLQSTSANGAPKSKDSAREVFDGIVLVKRNKNQTEEGVGDDGEGPNEERDGSEENAVIAAVNGDAQGDLSSLGGSNKGENNFFVFENINLFYSKRQDFVL